MLSSNLVRLFYRFSYQSSRSKRVPLSVCGKKLATVNTGVNKKREKSFMCISDFSNGLKNCVEILSAYRSNKKKNNSSCDFYIPPKMVY